MADLEKSSSCVALSKQCHYSLQSSDFAVHSLHSFRDITLKLVNLTVR